MKVRVLSFKNSCAGAVDAKLMADAATMTMMTRRILILLIMTMSPKAHHKFFVGRSESVKMIWQPQQSFKSPIYPLSDAELPIPKELTNESTRRKFGGYWERANFPTASSSVR